MWWLTAPLLVLAGIGVVTADSTGLRLPKSVLPHHYDLRIIVDIDPASNFTYYGIVNILVSCEEATDSIVLHAQKFNIKKDDVKVKTTEDSSNAYSIKNVSVEDELNFLTIKLDRSLKEKENYTVTVPFYGNLDEDLNGVYASSYLNKKTGQKEWLATTQFEPIYARRAFPCFDEPAMKATFKVTLGHSRDFSAVSNMPLLKTNSDLDMVADRWLTEEMSKVRSQANSDIIWDQFETSVPMSTYLLAFVISKFSYVESPSSLSDTKFKIWARSDAISQADYASKVGPSVLSYYEKFFDVPFPLPKQDMFAIPDFSAGAMENWGLITYRETALLYDENESSFMAKERVASVIAHELAHQWFGNLVTMKWWSDLWLNEGFATYVGSVGVQAIEPKWNHLNSESVDSIMTVFALDSLASSHPVSVDIDDPKRISEIFDAISYRKGSTIIRMMVMFLGEDVFRRGIKNYLEKYSYGNAEQDDLWQSLTEEAIKSGALPKDMTVKQIMDTWTKQTGYPLLNVVRNYDEKSASVTQKRYLALDAAANSSEAWWLPLKISSEGAKEARRNDITWLSDKQGTIQEHQLQHNGEKDQWLLFNDDMIALYRVNYDQRNWDLLSSALNGDGFRAVAELSRVQLMADSLELAWNNILDYTTALKLVNYLQHETELLPLETALGGLSRIENVLRRTMYYGAFQKYMRKLITKTYQNSGGLYTKKIINRDSLPKVQMQVMTSRWACRMKVPNCEQNAINMFQEWMQTDNPDTNNPIPVELRGTVYCVAIARGSVEHWAFLFQRYENANVAAAKNTMMSGLACTREIWILKQYLEWTVDNGTEVRKQDAASVMAGIASSSVGFYVAKPFLYNRIQDINSAFYGESRRIGGIVKTIVRQFTSQEELDEFLAWRAKNEKYLSGAKLSVEQAIENARVNINWLQRNQDNVVSLLREYAN